MKIKRGTVRDSDGFMFWGYYKCRNGERREQWCPPETFLRKVVAQREAKARESTPETRAARRAAYKLKPKQEFKYRYSGKRDPLKNAARQRLHYAVEFGKILKPDTCSRCGVRPKSKTGIQGHHADYRKALDVKWLCRECHELEHATANAGLPVKSRRRKWEFTETSQQG